MRTLSCVLTSALAVALAAACGGEFKATDDQSAGNNEGDAGTGGAATGSGAAAGSGGASAATGGRAAAGGRATTGGGTSAGGTVVCCGAVPSCSPGETEIPLGQPCPAGWACRDVSLCCSAITCGSPEGTCDAYPVCNPGDRTLTGACPPNLVCYERSLCGSTVYCVPQAVDGGVADAGPSCNPAAEYNRQYISTSADECLLIDFICDTGSDGFWNDCGCGCEQPSWCPEVVNCMPGAIPAFVPPPGGVPLPPLPDPCHDTTTCPFTDRAY